MSSPCDWLVQIPDLPDAHESRTSHLAAHLEYNKPQVVAGKMVLSGPTLASQPALAGAPPAITGSLMCFRTGSEAELWEILNANPYAQLGVWDMPKAVVTPFKCAVRTAL